jgi:hypothetical protein
MNERRRALDRLDDVRFEGVFEEDRYRAGRADVLGGDRFAVVVVRDDDPGDALLEVDEAISETEHGHHLRGSRKDEAVLAGYARDLAPEPDCRLPEHAIVHVDRAGPPDPVDRDVGVVALLDVIIDHRRDEVVRRGERVQVTREVEVDVLHRQDLGVPTAGRAALDAEDRSQRRLADRRERRLPDPIERLAQSDRRHRLAFSHRRRGHARDEDYLPVFAI